MKKRIAAMNAWENSQDGWPFGEFSLITLQTVSGLTLVGIMQS